MSAGKRRIPADPRLRSDRKPDDPVGEPPQRCNAIVGRIPDVPRVNRPLAEVRSLLAERDNPECSHPEQQQFLNQELAGWEPYTQRLLRDMHRRGWVDNRRRFDLSLLDDLAQWLVTNGNADTTGNALALPLRAVMLAFVGTEKESPATARKRGRKKPNPNSARRDDQLAAEWEQAKTAGVYKDAFAAGKGLKRKELDRLLDRVSKRKTRLEKKFGQ